MRSLERNPGRQYGPKTFQWWYDPLIDWLMANPNGKLGEAAVAFNKSVSYMSVVVNSDVFKERYAERRRELEVHLREEILNRSARVAVKGLTKIEERLDNQDSAKMGIKTLSEVTETALKVLGYGDRGPTVVVNNSNSIDTQATPSAIEQARAQIRTEQFSRIREESAEQEPPHPDLFEGVETFVDIRPPSADGLGPLADLDKILDLDSEEIVLVHENA